MYGKKAEGKFFTNGYRAVEAKDRGRVKSWPIAASTVKYKFRNKLREPLPCPIMYSASEELALWNMRTEEHGRERKREEEKRKERERREDIDDVGASKCAGYEKS